MYQKNKLKMTSFSQPKNNTGSLLIITSKNGLNSTKNLSLEEESNNNLKVHNTISNLIDVINENNLNFLQYYSILQRDYYNLYYSHH